MMTPSEILEAKTPRGAATRFYLWLRQQAKLWRTSGEVWLAAPPESAKLGYGKFWTVGWESGPFEWVMVSAGERLDASEVDDYSPGPFPEGLLAPGWYAEAYNGFVLCFLKHEVIQRRAKW